jgi:hypothetical protein
VFVVAFWSPVASLALSGALAVFYLLPHRPSDGSPAEA